MKMLSLFFTFALSTPAFADITVYTDRPTARMQVVADMYKAAGGENIKIVELQYEPMIQQLQQEGANSPADVIFVKDMVYLTALARDGRLQPVTSALMQNVDPSMRDPNNLWTAVTYRARTLVYSANLPEDVVANINTYEDLANPDYEKSLCLRSGKNAYNQALVASLITSYGSEIATKIVDGWLENRPDVINYADDTKVLEAISQGKCALGLTNSYYLGLQLVKNSSFPVKLKFLDQDKGGVHTNGTGAGVSATSKQPQVASKFVDFLLSEPVQIYFTNEHQDYAANTKVQLQNKAVGFGPFKVNSTNWSKIGENLPAAKTMTTDLGFD